MRAFRRHRRPARGSGRVGSQPARRGQRGVMVVCDSDAQRRRWGTGHLLVARAVHGHGARAQRHVAVVIGSSAGNRRLTDARENIVGECGVPAHEEGQGSHVLRVRRAFVLRPVPRRLCQAPEAARHGAYGSVGWPWAGYHALDSVEQLQREGGGGAFHDARRGPAQWRTRGATQAQCQTACLPGPREATRTELKKKQIV